MRNASTFLLVVTGGVVVVVVAVVVVGGVVVRLFSLPELVGRPISVINSGISGWIPRRSLKKSDEGIKKIEVVHKVIHSRCLFIDIHTHTHIHNRGSLSISVFRLMVIYICLSVCWFVDWSTPWFLSHSIISVCLYLLTLTVADDNPYFQIKQGIIGYIMIYPYSFGRCNRLHNSNWYFLIYQLNYLELANEKKVHVIFPLCDVGLANIKRPRERKMSMCWISTRTSRPAFKTEGRRNSSGWPTSPKPEWTWPGHTRSDQRARPRSQLPKRQRKSREQRERKRLMTGCWTACWQRKDYCVCLDLGHICGIAHV